MSDSNDKPESQEMERQECGGGDAPTTGTGLSDASKQAFNDRAWNDPPQVLLSSASKKTHVDTPRPRLNERVAFPQSPQKVSGGSPSLNPGGTPPTTGFVAGGKPPRSGGSTPSSKSPAGAGSAVASKSPPGAGSAVASKSPPGAGSAVASKSPPGAGSAVASKSPPSSGLPPRPTPK